MDNKSLGRKDVQIQKRLPEIHLQIIIALVGSVHRKGQIVQQGVAAEAAPYSNRSKYLDPLLICLSTKMYKM